MMQFRIKLRRPHPGQAQVIREAARFNVLECGRRFGKTTLGQNLAAEAAINGKPVGWFAPTYRTMLEQWREMVRDLSPLITMANRQDGQIRLLTGGVIDFWSLDNPVSGRGRKYGRVIIDEASIVAELEEAWEQTVRPTLTDLRGDAWFLGTPKGRNYFHRLFCRGESGEEDWRAWRLGTITNPMIDADEIESARRDLPPHVFAQEYEGIPADDGGNPFDLAAIRACVAPLSTAAPIVWGWDLAKSVDWTVGIALDRDGAVCRVERWQKPWDQTLQAIQFVTKDAPALVDSTGVGDPVLEQLQKGRSNYYGFKFSQTSKQQLMEGLAVAIQRQTVHFPAGVIQQELEAFEYEYRPTGVRYSAPHGLHDDCVCALALALQCWQSRRQPNIMPVIVGQGRSKWQV